MLAVDPYSPSYTNQYPYLDGAEQYLQYQPLSPTKQQWPQKQKTPSPASTYDPATFVFDPFADEEYSSSSSGTDAGREVQRLQKVEFLRQREWMRRVEAWVDGVKSGMTDPQFQPCALPPTPASTFSQSQSHSRLYHSRSAPNFSAYTPTPDFDTPFTYYSSSSSLPCSAAGDLSASVPMVTGIGEPADEEPYVIYSTPLPQDRAYTPQTASTSPPIPPSAPAAAQQPKTVPTVRRIHSRFPSLSSIREEDESAATRA